MARNLYNLKLLRLFMYVKTCWGCLFIKDILFLVLFFFFFGLQPRSKFGTVLSEKHKINLIYMALQWPAPAVLATSTITGGGLDLKLFRPTHFLQRRTYCRGMVNYMNDLAQTSVFRCVHGWLALLLAIVLSRGIPHHVLQFISLPVQHFNFNVQTPHIVFWACRKPCWNFEHHSWLVKSWFSYWKVETIAMATGEGGTRTSLGHKVAPDRQNLARHHSQVYCNLQNELQMKHTR